MATSGSETESLERYNSMTSWYGSMRDGMVIPERDEGRCFI